MLSVISIATLIILNQALIQYLISENNSGARTINLAGRQRMISQKLVKETYKLTDNFNNLENIKQLADSWNNVHLGLQFGDEKLGLIPNENDTIRELFKDLYPHQKKILKAVNSIYSPQDIKRAILQLNDAEQQFLPIMDEIVATFERQEKRNLYQIALIEISLAILSLIIILGELVFLIFPIIKESERVSIKALAEQESLQKAQTLLKAIYDGSGGIMLFVDVNQNILFFNKKAKELFRTWFQITLEEGKNLKLLGNEQFYLSINSGINLAISSNQYLETKQVKINEQNYYFLLHCFAVHDDDRKKLKGISILIEDITRFNSLTLRIEEQNQQLSDIAWKQAHELRSPISTLMQLVSTIDRTTLDAYNKELIGYADDLMAKIDAIIHNIIELTYNKDTNK